MARILRVRRLPTVALIAGLILLLAAAQRADGALMTFPGSNGKVLFTRIDDGLYKANPDGSAIRLVRRGDVRGGRWSPDGRLIAFFAFPRNCECHILKVMRGNGSDVHRVAKGHGFFGAPQWSPSGRRIAYISRNQVWTVKPDGTGIRRLTTRQSGMNDLSWSPSRRWITYSSNKDGDYDLYAVRSDGSRTRRLTDNEVNDFSPQWSSSRPEIAFVSEDTDRSFDVFLMPFDGEPVRIADTTYQYGFPTWSPNGELLAVNENHAGPTDPPPPPNRWALMNRDGSVVGEIVQGNIGTLGVVWSPDSGSVFFDRDGDLFTFDVSTGTEALLIDGPGEYRADDWQAVMD